MRVLQVNKLYPPWIGGIEKTVQSIAESLKDRVHMEVLVCQPRGGSRVDLVNGVRVHRAASLGIYRSMPISLTFPLLLKRLSRDADVVHFHAPFPLGEASSFLVDRSKPLVVTWHSDIIRQRQLLKAYQIFLRRFLDRVSAILVTSPMAIDASNFLRDYREKCHVVPLGIDLLRFEMDDDCARRTERIRQQFGQPLVLFVGRLVYYKGLEYLIEAMRDVKGSLVIVGSGGLRDRLVQCTARNGTKERVQFLDHLPEQDLVALLHACDLFVLPSVQKSEMFGIVQLEAMACAKPVVNTALATGVPFVSQDGVTGLTVPPRDSTALAKAINKLLADAELRERFGRQGRTRVEREFTLGMMAERILKVYDQLAEV